MLKDIIASLTLITKLPLGDRYLKSGDLAKAVIHFPMAGYLSFVLWYFVYEVSYNVFKDQYISVCISFVIVYFLFNLFHFDGFLDSIDGLLSQKPKEEALNIMKLGNIGPTALFFGVIYLVLKMYIATKLNIFILLPVFVIARWGMSFAACISHPARSFGLGALITFRKPEYLAVSSLYILVLFVISTPRLICLMTAVIIIFDYLLIKSVERKIGGLTGDSFGLVNEMNEILLMLSVFVLD